MGIVWMRRAAGLRAEACGVLVTTPPFEMRLPVCILAMDQAATERSIEGGGQHADDCNQAMERVAIHWRVKCSYRQDSLPSVNHFKRVFAFHGGSEDGSQA